MCNVNGSTFLPNYDERDLLRHQGSDERHVTAEPVELGNGDFAPGVLCFGDAAGAPVLASSDVDACVYRKPYPS
jgi:hypothetical protein